MIDYNMPMADYLAHPAIGSSRLKAILNSPLDFKHYADQVRKDTDATIFGEAVHTAVLEPHLFDSLYALQPEDFGNRAKGDGKKKWDAFKKENEGKIFLGYPEALKLDQIRCSAADHKGLQDILSKSLSVEATAFCGTQCKHDLKARSDVLCKNDLWDVKTSSRGVSDSEISRTIFKMGYHFQLAHHMHVWNENEYEIESFGWIFVDTENPGCHIVIRRASERLIKAAKKDFEYALGLLQECDITGKWPGYCHGISEIDLPDYAMRWYE